MSVYPRNNRPSDGRVAFRCPRPDGTFKTSWPSAAKARRAAIRLRMHGYQRLYAYQCPRCRYWHLTKQPTRGALRPGRISPDIQQKGSDHA